MTDPRVQATIELLQARGERITTARRQLLEVLADADEHLTADGLVSALAERDPTAHRATVYRTLDWLVREGIVAHVHLVHGPATYHLAPLTPDHLHLSCRRCGAVLDAPPDLLDAAARRLRADLGFELDAGHVALTGRCASCQPA